MNPTLYAYLAAKLKEPTTYAGLVMIFGWLTHNSVPPEIAGYIENGCVFIVGALLMWANERASAKANQTPPTGGTESKQ